MFDDVYRSLWDDPWSHYRLGIVYEDLGDPVAAGEAYRWPLEAWTGAHPEWRPLLDEVRAGVERLEEGAPRDPPYP